MNDLSWRIIILGLVAAVVMVAVWRSRRSKRTEPVHVSRPDLGAGVHFFSSATCAPCVDARRVLESVYGDGFVEIRFEDDPAGFGVYGISSVPTVFVLDSDGNGRRFEGVPSPRRLRTQGS
ncbi:MAG TPA: thioredoxin family protein [Acidimicrobiia bacterium]|nr:thioredoxin family protein [Acidimicrobiia bacterium]